jgi:outer membrane protein assembly factor BamB
MRNKLKEKKNRMNRKTKGTIVSLFLLFAMTISLIALSPANAQEPATFKTYAFIGAVPNPVGVGQEVLLHVGITQQLSSALVGWEGLTVTVERPDGKTETLGPFKTDSTGGTGTVYVPTMEGTYYLQTKFPEQEMPEDVRAFAGITIPAGSIMQASTSDKLELVVQEEAIPYYPPHALPTEYWTRPIDAQLREWASISGSWLMDPRNMYVPYNDGPDTAHILWTTPMTSGGTVGGALDNAQGFTEHSYEMGDAYEGKFGIRFIMGGKLYYNKYANGDAYCEIVCVDLHTGEVLWSKTLVDQENQPVIPTMGFRAPTVFGQLMYWDTYDYHGVYDYIWVPRGSTYTAFDPFTGDYVATLTNVPSGTMTYGPKGEMLIYTIDTRHGWMTMWNSSNIPDIYASRDYASMGWGQWKIMGRTINATGPVSVTRNYQPYTAPTTPLGLNGYMWNISIPDDLPGSAVAVFPLDRVIGSSITSTEVVVWGINLNESKGAIGQVLFENTWNAPSEWSTGNLYVSSGAVSTEDGLYVLWSKEEQKYYGFSTNTGKYLWKTAESEYYLQIYVATSSAIVNGKLYSTGASGVLYCYDATTGEKLWEYHANDPYSEILWANDWWLGIEFITDGKIYLGHQEHSPIDPRPRGAPFICLNATTGEEIWRSDGLFRQNHWGGEAIMGDGIIATMDTYDQRVYGIGKGPSATTVSGPDESMQLGKSVQVRGTVTDISPGTNSAALEMRFPNGVPAVSDANMSDWMLYVYKQFERPADVMGVEVVVSVLDPNNNVYEVGRTTSDSSGFFTTAFTPEVPGEYTVIASFAGSGAYYGSYAETSINIEEAPTTTPEPTTTPVSAADLYFLPVSGGIIAAIVVILGLLILLLRKR